MFRFFSETFSTAKKLLVFFCDIMRYFLTLCDKAVIEIRKNYMPSLLLDEASRTITDQIETMNPLGKRDWKIELAFILLTTECSLNICFKQFHNFCSELLQKFQFHLMKKFQIWEKCGIFWFLVEVILEKSFQNSNIYFFDIRW